MFKDEAVDIVQEGGCWISVQCCMWWGVYLLIFWHGDAPMVEPAYKHLDLSNTTTWVIWLAKQLPNLWTCIYMDNLYNSEKLFTSLIIAKCLAHGVACVTGCDILDGIKQAVKMLRRQMPWRAQQQPQGLHTQRRAQTFWQCVSMITNLCIYPLWLGRVLSGLWRKERCSSKSQFKWRWWDICGWMWLTITTKI